MRPFTEYVLTSNGDAGVVLNIYIWPKSRGNKVINRQKVEVTTSGANTDSCRREPPLLRPLPTQEQIGSCKAPTLGQHHWTAAFQEKDQGGWSFHVCLQVPFSFPASTAARRRNKETEINKTKLKAIIV